jgi:hypothetical protein
MDNDLPATCFLVDHAPEKPGAATWVSVVSTLQAIKLPPKLSGYIENSDLEVSVLEFVQQTIHRHLPNLSTSGMESDLYLICQHLNNRTGLRIEPQPDSLPTWIMPQPRMNVHRYHALVELKSSIAGELPALVLHRESHDQFIKFLLKVNKASSTDIKEPSVWATANKTRMLPGFSFVAEANGLAMRLELLAQGQSLTCFEAKISSMHDLHQFTDWTTLEQNPRGLVKRKRRFLFHNDEPSATEIYAGRFKVINEYS